jgi:hypothetical protein
LSVCPKKHNGDNGLVPTIALNSSPSLPSDNAARRLTSTSKNEYRVQAPIRSA